MAEKVRQMSALSRTVVEGLLGRGHSAMEILSSVADLDELMKQKAVIETIVGLNKLMENESMPNGAMYQAPVFAHDAAHLDAVDQQKFQSLRATLHQSAWSVSLKLTLLRARIDAALTLDEAVDLAKFVRVLKQADKVVQLGDAATAATPAPVAATQQTRHNQFQTMPTFQGAASQRRRPSEPIKPQLQRAQTLHHGGVAENAVKNDYLDAPWFVNTPRQAAEQMLANKPRGSFVVRPASVPGCLSLTHVDLATGVVGHGLIRRYTGPAKFGWGMESEPELFASVQELLQSLPLRHDDYPRPKPLPTTPFGSAPARRAPMLDARAQSERRLRPSLTASASAPTRPLADSARESRDRAMSIEDSLDAATASILDDLSDFDALLNLDLDTPLSVDAPPNNAPPSPNSAANNTPTAGPARALSPRPTSPRRALPTPGAASNGSRPSSPGRALPNPAAVNNASRALPTPSTNNNATPSAAVVNATRALPTPTSSNATPNPAVVNATRALPTPTNSTPSSPRAMVANHTTTTTTTATSNASPDKPPAAESAVDTKTPAAALAPPTLTVDMASLRTSVAGVRDANAREHEQLVSRETTALTSTKPFESDPRLEQQLSEQLSGVPLPGHAPPPPPAVYDEYARLHAALPASRERDELMQELAPLIDQLQRLTWQREFAEAQLATREEELRRARTAFAARRFVVEKSSVSGRGATRSVLVRAASVAAANARLVGPEGALQRALEAFDVRDAPRSDGAAVDAFKAPQNQLLRAMVDLAHHSREAEAAAVQLCAELTPIAKLLDEMKL